jgi:hypothetical protein
MPYKDKQKQLDYYKKHKKDYLLKKKRMEEIKEYDPIKYLIDYCFCKECLGQGFVKKNVWFAVYDKLIYYASEQYYPCLKCKGTGYKSTQNKQNLCKK